MRYSIIQKNFIMRETFVIKNKNLDEDKYFAKGRLMSTGRDYRLIDTDGQTVARIKRKFFSFMPHYHIFISGVHIASVRRVASLRQSYEIIGLNWRLSGDFAAHNYQLKDENGNIIMSFSKKLNSWGDNFELDIGNPAYALHSICIALSVQMAIKAIRSVQNN